MHTEDITETNPQNGTFSIFGHAVTLTFDLLTPKPNKSIHVSKCTSNKSGENPAIHTIDIEETTSPTVEWMDAQTDAETHGQHENIMPVEQWWRHNK